MFVSSVQKSTTQILISEIYDKRHDIIYVLMYVRSVFFWFIYDSVCARGRNPKKFCFAKQQLFLKHDFGTEQKFFVS